MSSVERKRVLERLQKVLHIFYLTFHTETFQVNCFDWWSSWLVSCYTRGAWIKPPQLQYSQEALLKNRVQAYSDRHTNMPGNLNVMDVLNNQWKFSKKKCAGYLLGLTMMVIITTSYILGHPTWDKKGLLHFIPSPNQLRLMVVPNSTTAANVFPENNLNNTNLLEMISSKLEYKPRKVPEEKDLIEVNSQMFSVIPRHFLPGIKSPCWYEEEVSVKLSTDPQRKKAFCQNSTIKSKPVRKHLTTKFQQPLYHNDGKLCRLRCLPFFYIIGQPKCGTTDLFFKLRQHPCLRFMTTKEPHFWTRSFFNERYPLEQYLNWFDLAAHNIQEEIRANSSGTRCPLQIITGEASASTMWDNKAFQRLQKDKEPSFLVQDFIHTFHPGAKIITILRDPVERLYSDYLYFHRNNKSPEKFHGMVTESIQLFQSCLSERSLRFCIYSSDLLKAMPVRLLLGMYIVFLWDWLTVFQREQILVIQLEEYSTNFKVTIRKVFDFLGVGPLSEQMEEAISNQRKRNIRKKEDKKLGHMLPATRDLLKKVYKGFNRKLASFLENKAFLWSTT